MKISKERDWPGGRGPVTVGSCAPGRAVGLTRGRAGPAGPTGAWQSRGRAGVGRGSRRAAHLRVLAESASCSHRCSVACASRAPCSLWSWRSGFRALSTYGDAAVGTSWQVVRGREKGVIRGDTSEAPAETRPTAFLRKGPPGAPPERHPEDESVGGEAGGAVGHPDSPAPRGLPPAPRCHTVTQWCR